MAELNPLSGLPGFEDAGSGCLAELLATAGAGGAGMGRGLGTAKGRTSPLGKAARPETATTGGRAAGEADPSEEERGKAVLWLPSSETPIGRTAPSPGGGMCVPDKWFIWKGSLE